MKIMVYFNNGNCAKMDAEKTVFISGQIRPMPDTFGGILCLAGKGLNVVNWENVSFVRVVEDEAD